MPSESSTTTAQLQCTQQGGPFDIVQVPAHTIPSGHVLIRQRFIALNALDYKQRDFGIMIAQWPIVLGVEGAGVVEAVAPDVADVKPGDEVTARVFGPAGGAYQERVVVPAYNVAKKPRNISLQDAASLPICYITAVCAIYDGLKVPLPFLSGTSTSGSPPKSVLILGGGAGSGASAVQLLRLAYPSLPIFVTASSRHHELLMELGATKAFDYRSSSLAGDIKVASPRGVGVDMIIDCVASGASQTDIYTVFDPAGSKKYAALLTGQEFSVPEGVNKSDVNAAVLADLEGGKLVLPALTQLVEDGRYKVPLPVRVVGNGLGQLAKAVDLLKAVSGEKLIVAL